VFVVSGGRFSELCPHVHGQRHAIHGGGVCGVARGHAGPGTTAAVLLARAGANVRVCVCV